MHYTQKGNRMKRFHVHVSVDDLASSIRFYSKLFGHDPTVIKDDYAKWLVEDPRVNFAISHRGATAGVNHLGIQTDSEAELETLHGQLEKADIAAQSEQEISCCYARSNKYWVTDPTGLAWETFHTLGTVPTFDGAENLATIEPSSAPGSKQAPVCCAPQVPVVMPASSNAKAILL